ncbi:lipoprotein-releasing ABC transporter permease subunit [Massilia arenosa]|uniref:Lipoprotein-releasing ABC transporter permease subunit n=1 Tax=Zemynaea arenosa TaxID=2561931 RepID=A0A4Y9SEB5_9BURK|nr:lipoprotein-releasing ABC transporter permease subunit [Massilia arenosa]TFW19026.1 lipoprotein-releasing ABC transporter permease subunit [Massilia arenosa]
MRLSHKLPYEWLVGWRYTRAGKRGRRQRFISFISFISIAGIGLGVAALIVVLSVMNGFQKEVAGRMLSILAHVEVTDARGSMPYWEQARAEVLRHPEVKAAAPFMETEGMLVSGDVLKPALVRGILPAAERGVSELAARVKSGSLDALRTGAHQIVLGRELAKSLDVSLGDTVGVAIAQGDALGEGSMPRVQPFTVAGIFDAGHYEYDSTLAFVALDDGEALAGLSAPSGIRLRLADPFRAVPVARALAQNMTGDVRLVPWTLLNATWFAAVASQKRMMFIILALIMAVAAFNLVSTLVMTVTDKKADIAILRTIGASPRSIMKIFVVQGTLTGLMGAGTGVLLGVLFALNIGTIVPAIESALGMHILNPEIYFISTVPSDVHWGDVAAIAGVSIALAFLSTLYPSWSAARVNPAEGLRYE